MPRSTLDKTDPKSLHNKARDATAPADAAGERDAARDVSQPAPGTAGTSEAASDSAARPRGEHGHDDRAHARRRRTLRSLRRRRSSKNVQR